MDNSEELLPTLHSLQSRARIRHSSPHLPPGYQIGSDGLVYREEDVSEVDRDRYKEFTAARKA